MKRALVVTLIVLAITVASGAVFSQSRRADRAVDPVCGLVVEKNEALSWVYKSQKYYFCSVRDRDAFTKDPDGYLRKR
jgi:YHS domain-containing protein